MVYCSDVGAMVHHPASPDKEGDFRSSEKLGNTPLVIGSVAGLMLIPAALMLFHRDIPTNPIQKDRAADELAGIEEILRPANPSDCLSLALDVLTRFFESPDLEGKISEVRDPTRVGALMRDYYSRRGHPFPTMAKVSDRKIAESISRETMIFVVEPFTGPDFAIALEWDRGRYRIDWESMVAYGTADWYEFTEGKSGSTERLRVFLSPLKDRWGHPALPVGAKSYLMEHRDFPDPVVAVSMAPESIRVVAMVTQPRTPVRVNVRWDKELGIFRIVDSPVPLWSD